MKIIRILVGIVISLLVLGAAAYVLAGFHDGPLAVIPGGPLVAGSSSKSRFPIGALRKRFKRSSSS